MVSPVHRSSIRPTSTAPEAQEIPSELSKDLFLLRDFTPYPEDLLSKAIKSYPWQGEMIARQTTSFGVPYTSIHVSYEERPFPPEVLELARAIGRTVGWTPNNCLVNYYASGGNSMGYHADDKNLMETGTGVAIVSIGAERTLSFRKIDDFTERFGLALPSGSLLYMSREMQDSWQHGVRKDASCESPRISFTFRKIPVPCS